MTIMSARICIGIELAEKRTKLLIEMLDIFQTDEQCATVTVSESSYVVNCLDSM